MCTSGNDAGRAGEGDSDETENLPSGVRESALWALRPVEELD